MQQQSSNYDYRPSQHSLGNPYASGAHNSNKSNGGPGKLFIFIGLGCGVVMVGCCLGVCGIGWLGLKIDQQDMIAALEDNPLVLEHLGQIESMKMNIVATGSEEDDSVFVYDVVGTKGSGKVTMKTYTADLTSPEEIIWARLRMDDGQTYQLIEE